ncbi:DUF1190 family protein [Paraglaciecola arctica]|uniref:Uncharacterized protein n=1 Tax=Paraglaciecola arctica BSs20135 TaxID=493475 RepID=K6YUX4_9ALTE|nr:DUF1190 family protein [Paraglaciecola arctica]GAC21962.1 hypothetical protein GARC_5027 [Paraglaciecola arctica BSs20135]
MQSNKTKRSKSINLVSMRKSFSVKPLALGIAAIFLTACGDDQDAAVFTSVDDCTNANPEFAAKCKTAYEDAVKEAERTGPKYNSQSDCETEFGNNQCRVVQRDSGSFFMPLMAGYMLSNLMSPRGYYSQPMFTSHSRNSSYRNRWIGADGHDFGDNRRRTMKVSEKSLKPKPTVTKTMSRGGFGSSVRAKSSWGSSSKKGGWGG